MQSATQFETRRISLPCWLVGVLVFGSDILVGGARHAPGPVDGAFSLPDPAPSGFVWTYLAEGRDFSDAPDLVVVMPDFDAPSSWTEHLLSRARRDLVKTMPTYDQVLPVREVSVAPDITFDVLQYPTATSNRAFRGWCERVGRNLLLMGGLAPNGCEGVLYTGPLPHPMTWDTPCLPRPRKTFRRDTQ